MAGRTTVVAPEMCIRRNPMRRVRWRGVRRFEIREDLRGDVALAARKLAKPGSTGEDRAALEAFLNQAGYQSGAINVRQDRCGVMRKLVAMRTDDVNPFQSIIGKLASPDDKTVFETLEIPAAMARDDVSNREKAIGLANALKVLMGMPVCGIMFGIVAKRLFPNNVFFQMMFFREGAVALGLQAGGGLLLYVEGALSNSDIISFSTLGEDKRQKQEAVVRWIGSDGDVSVCVAAFNRMNEQHGFIGRAGLEDLSYNF